MFYNQKKKHPNITRNAPSKMLIIVVGSAALHSKMMIRSFWLIANSKDNWSDTRILSAIWKAEHSTIHQSLLTKLWIAIFIILWKLYTQPRKTLWLMWFQRWKTHCVEIWCFIKTRTRKRDETAMLEYWWLIDTFKFFPSRLSNLV